MLTVGLLGPVEARTEQGPAPLTRPLERALLARLALAPGVAVDAGRLLDDLWAESSRGQASLHSTVYRLRRTLGDEGQVLEKQGAGYLLRIGREHVDACRFEELASQGSARYGAGDPEEASEPLAAALGLWRGPALADIGDVPFALAQRSRLEELRLSVLEQRVEADLDCGRHGLVVAELEAALVNQPLRERLWAQLMVALYRCGRQADALGAYHRLRSRLSEELGVDPSPELVALEEAILRQKRELNWVAHPPGPVTQRVARDGNDRPSEWKDPDGKLEDLRRPVPDLLKSMSGSWPLVGRETERSFVAALIKQGTSAGVVLHGEAGVGKTRLAWEAVRDAEERGCATAWVVATRAAASIPFGPFAPLIPQMPAGSVSRLDLLRQIAAALVARAAGRRLVVGVDDAHLLDDASATLVHQLAVSADAFVIVTLRAGEQAPDSIVALWKDGLAQRLELGTLFEEDVARLVPAVLGDQVDTPTSARLWNATRGNVLFLRELLLAGLEQGWLTQSGGVWGWKGSMAVSPRLHEIVAARLGTLDPDQLALMEIVAHGEPISACLLSNLSSQPTLETAERRGLVTVQADGRRMLVRLAHPLYAETVRARCPILRTRAVHRELASTLEATGVRRTDDVLRLAVFRLEAGEPGSPEVLVRAAQRALAVFHLELSERLARAADKAGGGIPSKLAIAQTLVDQGRSAEVAELLSDIDDIEATEIERTGASYLRGHVLAWGLGQPEEAIRLLLRAEKELQDVGLRDELRGLRAGILSFSGQSRAAIDVGLDVLGGAHASPRACVLAAPATCMALSVIGQTDRAAGLAERFVVVARRLAHELPFPPFYISVVQAGAHLRAGRFAEARRIGEDVHREALSRNALNPIGQSAALLGDIALARGETAAAVRWLREGVAMLRESPRLNLLPYHLPQLAQAFVYVGDLSAATAALAEAEAAMTAGMAMFEPLLCLTRAWLAAGHGDMPTARAVALDVADRMDASGFHALTVAALHELARFGDPRPSRLAAVAPLVDGPLAPACLAHAVALATGDGPGLEAAAASFAAIGAHLLAAEAAAEAAAAYRAGGNETGMQASTAQARLHLEVCKGVHTPALATLAAAGPAGSQRREPE